MARVLVVDDSPFQRKVAGVGPLLHPSDDAAADMAEIARFYATVTPKHPERWDPNWKCPIPVPRARRT